MIAEQDLNITGLSDIQKKRILSYAIEGRKAEIDRLWSRSLVFWGLVAASFVAFAALYKDHQTSPPELAISCFGLVCSFAWTLHNRGGKYWQEAWENKVRIAEKHVLGTNLFANREPLHAKGLWGAGRYSVSKLIIAVSDLTVLVWMGLTASAWPVDWASMTAKFGLSFPLRSVVVVFFVLYGFAMWIWGRSGK